MLPSISGNLVVWETRSGNPIVSEIRGVDLSNHEERVIASSTTSIYRYPRVSNTNIVWQSCVGSLCDVFGYDWTTGATRPITAGGSGGQSMWPDVDGNVAVYQVTRGGEKDICAFDLVAGTEKCLSLPGEQGYPRISGNYVVFNDTEPDYTMHLRLWHLGLDKVFDITTGYSSSQLLPDIDGNKVVYSDDRNGLLDIYLYEIHLPPTADAGPDQTVNVGTSAALSGSGTDPDQEYPLTYYWSIVSKPLGSVATIANPQLKDISFTPDLPGTYTLSLVTVDAMGIPSEADEVIITAQRSQQAADILAFFDQSVSNGTLTGQGPGNSASGKLNALRNMIAAAASLINQGDIAGACQQLLDAYRKTDGNPKPPDFVTGPAASELAAKIQALRQSLGCP
jgi:beta propeller repeat protein